MSNLYFDINPMSVNTFTIHHHHHRHHHHYQHRPYHHHHHHIIIITTKTTTPPSSSSTPPSSSSSPPGQPPSLSTAPSTPPPSSSSISSLSPPLSSPQLSPSLKLSSSSSSAPWSCMVFGVAVSYQFPLYIYVRSRRGIYPYVGCLRKVDRKEFIHRHVQPQPIFSNFNVSTIATTLKSLSHRSTFI